ncbi:MAG: helix-turn-helix domain-containing protein [Thermomicrobiales bacterium]|nr:helix-turn-helix domain-containing protein [Thermomicrobiales bacterium]
MDTSRPFGELLRAHRSAAGLTQEELAERSGLSVDAIGLLERGARRLPRRDTVRRLVAALQLTDDERVALQQAARAQPPGGTDVTATLPTPTTSFIGRALEIDEIGRLLRESNVRLLTLTGAGGVGKTRLAIEAARQVADVFDDVAFVALAAIRDAANAIEAMSLALGVRLLGAGGAAQVPQPARDVLLVLDNCEHLDGIAPYIGELLATLPRLTMLATSRRPLGISAERRYPVLPLPVDRAVQPGQVLSAGVLLFADRARAHDPAFALTAANLPDVAAICRRVDGLPLAIELAAAWIRLLPPSDLLRRLDPALPLLTGGPRDLPERQQTLRATIDWSYDLIDPEVQRTLRSLAVMEGGFIIAAAEAVVAAPDVLSSLAALVDAGLLARLTDADPARYVLLETVREYAVEQLATSGDEVAVRDRHLAWCLEFVEAAQPHLVGPDESIWLAKLSRENANLQVAVRRALDQRAADIATRFAAVLWRYWAGRGRLSEGRRWLEQILVLAGAADPGAVPPLRLAMLMHVTANLARVQGDAARAEALYRACLTIRREHNDRPGIVAALHNIGIVLAERGDHDAALRCYQDALVLATDINDPYGIAFIQTSIGEVLLASGELDGAVTHVTEGLRGFQAIGHSWGVALATTRLGDVVLAQDDIAQAKSLQRKSLALSADLADPRSFVDALDGLARALSVAQPATCVRMAGAADALRARFDCPRPAHLRVLHDDVLATARRTLSDAAAGSAYLNGAEAAEEESLPALVAILDH